METQNKPHLIPISDKEFQKKVAKGPGIKYRSKILLTELKAMLGYCPLNRRKIKVEITDESGSSKVLDSLGQAVRERKNYKYCSYALCIKERKKLCNKKIGW